MMTETSHVSYGKISAAADSIMHGLIEGGGEVGITILALSLVMARLACIEHPLSDEEEVKWIEDMNEWSMAYFAEGVAS